MGLHFVHSEPYLSEAQRLQGLKPTASMIGVMVYAEKERELYYESELERRCILKFMRDPAVADIREQHTVTDYVDEHGKIHQHTWDLTVTYKNGLRELIFVKPLYRVLQRLQEEFYNTISDFVCPQVAETTRLITERDLPADLIDLADICNIAMLAPPPHLADQVFSLIQSSEEPLQVGEIVRNFVPKELHASRRPELIASAYWSVVLAVARREAMLVSDGFFAMDSFVQQQRIAA